MTSYDREGNVLDVPPSPPDDVAYDSAAMHVWILFAEWVERDGYYESAPADLVAALAESEHPALTPVASDYGYLPSRRLRFHPWDETERKPWQLLPVVAAAVEEGKL